MCTTLSSLTQAQVPPNCPLAKHTDQHVLYLKVFFIEILHTHNDLCSQTMHGANLHTLGNLRSNAVGFTFLQI